MHDNHPAATKHLLVISLGPVHEFITAARRTRDLWFGSFLLSEISKAAAHVVHQATQGNGGLIFPSSDDLDRQLVPANKDNLLGTFNIVNVILAEIPERSDPRALAERAKWAARLCWKFWAREAKQAAKPIIRMDIWRMQLDDLVECYAAWTPLVGDYGAARRRVMRLLDGRKALRDFVPARGIAGVPKSSLDGLRETVLIDKNEQGEDRAIVLGQYPELAFRLRLRAGEQLDAAGLTKRAATKAVFPSVVRVAVDPWVRGIKRDGDAAANTLEQIKRLCKKLVPARSVDEERASGQGGYYPDFPYDGAILLPDRIAAMLGNEDESSVFDPAILTEINLLLTTLVKDLGYGEPEPYLAVLIADGDQMGKVLSSISDVACHRALSGALTLFTSTNAHGGTDNVREIVREHSGCTVFAGGEDILALLPVDQCLPCARCLRDRYVQLMEHFKYVDGNEEKTPTLSVGIAIGHCLEPLEDLLQYAQDAEKHAKSKELGSPLSGDGLAVHLHSRGGPPITLRDQWRNRPDERLQLWADFHLQEALSDKAAYDLHSLAHAYARWRDASMARSALQADALHLIQRKKIAAGPCDAAAHHIEVALAESRSSGRGPHSGVVTLASEWIVARRLARVQAQAMGRGNPSDGQDATRQATLGAV